MNQVKLSIIVPVYNVERYVERCLRSVLSQGIPATDYEVIIQNDGSTDGSLAVVERVVKDHANCLVLCSQNRGLSAARNAALCHAQGEYVWFVDSDDWIEEGCLKVLLEETDRSHADLYNFGYKSCLNNVVAVTEMPTSKIGLIGVWGHLYRRQFLLDNDLTFVEGIAHEDFEFSPRVAFLAKKYVTLDMSPYVVYKRPGSITTSPNVQKAIDMLTVCRSLHEFQQKHKGEGCDLTEWIALGLNNGLQTFHLFHFSKEQVEMVNKAYGKHKDLFVYLRRSKVRKYNIEYLVFSLFPSRCVTIFQWMKKFNRRQIDMESITNQDVVTNTNRGGKP